MTRILISITLLFLYSFASSALAYSLTQKTHYVDSHNPVFYGFDREWQSSVLEAFGKNSDAENWITLKALKNNAVIIVPKEGSTAIVSFGTSDKFRWILVNTYDEHLEIGYSIRPASDPNPFDDRYSLVQNRKETSETINGIRFVELTFLPQRMPSEDEVLNFLFQKKYGTKEGLIETFQVVNFSKPPTVIAKKTPEPEVQKRPERQENQIAEKPNAPNKTIELLPVSSGSGFAISKKGYVITNNHVIDGCQKINIHDENGAENAKVVATDQINDIAVLKAEFEPIATLSLSAKKPSLLEEIYVAGFPFGQNLSSSVKVTKGIVSSLTGLGNNSSELQIDAALQTGNSGGPIITKDGTVLAVAVSKLDYKFVLENFGTIPENTNFGVKSLILENLLDSYRIEYDVKNGDSLPLPELGELIQDTTVFISCWMDEKTAEKLKSQKVMFVN